MLATPPRPAKLSGEQLALAKTGRLPDQRTVLGRASRSFIDMVKRSYSENWSEAHEIRLLLAYPWVLLNFSLPVVAVKDGQAVIAEGWRKSNYALQTLLQDLARLSDVDRRDERVPTLADIIQEAQEVEKK